MNKRVIGFDVILIYVFSVKWFSCKCIFLFSISVKRSGYKSRLLWSLGKADFWLWCVVFLSWLCPAALPLNTVCESTNLLCLLYHCREECCFSLSLFLPALLSAVSCFLICLTASTSTCLSITSINLYWRHAASLCCITVHLLLYWYDGMCLFSCLSSCLSAGHLVYQPVSLCYCHWLSGCGLVICLPLFVSWVEPMSWICIC